MYIVIVGIGRTGRRIAELATRDQHEVVVIDHDEKRAAAASKDFDCMVVQADATSQNVLNEVGTADADALITTTPDDAINLMVMMLGRELGARQLLSSVSNPAHIRLFQQMGIHIVESPHRLNGQFFYRAVQRPSIRDFMELGDGAEIIELSVRDEAPLAGPTLEEANRQGLMPAETLIVAVRRERDLIVPTGRTTLASGDLVTVFSRRGATPKVLTAFTGRAA